MIAKKSININNELLEYVSSDVEITRILVNSIENKLKTKDMNITIPQNPDLSTPMWLCTDKDGSSRIIKCSAKPLRDTAMWYPGNGDYIEAYIDSPFSAKFFGIFWKKAAEELKKIGLPKWEDDPVEIEVSRIKINYY